MCVGERERKRKRQRRRERKRQSRWLETRTTANFNAPLVGLHRAYILVSFLAVHACLSSLVIRRSRKCTFPKSGVEHPDYTPFHLSLSPVSFPLLI